MKRGEPVIPGLKPGLTLLMIILVCGMALRANLAYADHADDSYRQAAKKYHLLYQNTRFRDKESNWLQTIKQFYFIFDQYPKHRRAPESLYSIGKLYRSLYLLNKKSIYLDRSSISFRKLINEYPSSPLADNAQFKIAENYDKYKNDANLAIAEYDYFISRFPSSDIRSAVEKRLLQLRPDRKTETAVADFKKGLDPDDLTTPRYGGLAVEEVTMDQPAGLVSKVDYWATSEWSRMVINVSSEVRYKYQVLEGDSSHPQKRFFIDVGHAYLPDGFKRSILADDGLISKVRIAQYDKETVRVVLDLISLDRIKVFHFPLPNQYKIVIDIFGEKTGFNSTYVERDETSQSDNSVGTDSYFSSVDEEVSLPDAFGLKVRRIILDPGHGGRDPGAVANGLKEKDVTLRIALALRDIIRKNHPQITVMMTRDKDIYVPLEERTAFANKNRGDLFVSIHVNASPHPKAHGLETYYLNLTSDNDALNLAAKENQTSMKSISDLQSILNDLLTNSKIQESSELAEFLQASVITSIGDKGHEMRDLGVKKAPFIVLLGAQMPSVLIELGFLTNDDESRLLKKRAYRLSLAEGIYAGVSRYIN